MLISIKKQAAYALLVFAAFCVYTATFILLTIDKQYFYTLLLDNRIVGSFTENILGLSYIEYAQSPMVASIAYTCRYTCLSLLLLCSVLTLVALLVNIAVYKKVQKIILYAGAVAVAIFFLVQIIDIRNYLLIAEYTIIIFTPFLFTKAFNTQSVQFLNTHFIKLIIVLTFCSHGFFALGISMKTPAAFIDMIIHCTGVKQATAKQLLKIAGVLDFVFAACLIFSKKGSRLQTYSLAYLAAWGLLTAFARILGNYYADLGWYNVRQFIPETLVRLPHCLIPLILLLMGWQYRKSKNKYATFIA